MTKKIPASAVKATGGFIKKRVGYLFRDAKGRLRDARGRFAKDPWRLERKKLPNAKTLIKNGREYKGAGGKGRHKNAFPNKAGPGETLYRRDPHTGKVTYYAVYDKNGNIVKRVDLNPNSAVHDGVPTPHTVYYHHDKAPDGTVHVRPDKKAYPATDEEIP